VQAPEDLGDVWQLPFIRMGHSAVFDPVGDRMVAFGGWNGQQFFNDVWALDVTTPGEEAWTKLDPAGAWPPPRGMHSAIYDSANERMIVFGGRGFHYNFDDVWALDLTTAGAESWTMVQPAGDPPPARRWHTAIYDGWNARMLVFGGGGSGGLMNDVWALSLTPGAEAWSEVPVSGSVPDARWQHTAINTGTADELGRMIIFGGQTSGGTLMNDAWELDLETHHWSEMAVGPTKPSARRGHTAVRDAQHFDRMLVFGGQGADGFTNDLWRLSAVPGEYAWQQLDPNGGPPGPRAWHAAGMRATNAHMYVIGGRGMGTFQGETQWSLNVGGMMWSPLWPTLPGWWGGGKGARPDVTLHVEDAAANQAVNLLSDSDLEPHFVVKIFTPSADYKNDVDVTLTLPEGKFDKNSVRAGARTLDTPDEPIWSTPQYLGNGQFRLNDVDLATVSGGYSIQVVFKANTIEGVTGSAALTAKALGTNWLSTLESTGTVRFYTDPNAWVVTSRKGLFDEYSDGEVTALLDELFARVYDRPGVVIYPDRYLNDLALWDNTEVSYASEPIANEVSDQLADWLTGRQVMGARAFPDYMLIVGDDNVVPFYRQYDDTGAEGDEPDAEDPVIEALVSHNYFFTDNPYGDGSYGTGSDDWETGDLDAAVGRIVGATADDMATLVRSGRLGPRASAGRALLASVSDWDLWLPGTDIVSVIMNDLGYAVNQALIDDSATKSQAVDEMQMGLTAMVLGGHGGPDGVNMAGPGSWPGGERGIVGYQLPQYDVGGCLSYNRIFFEVLGCRTGFSHSIEGAYGSMVYALAHHEASGGIAMAGLACCATPGRDVASESERLTSDVWVWAKLDATKTNPLGWSLMRAKGNYVPTDGYWGTDDEKVLQQTTYFGLPWMRLYDSTARGELKAVPADAPGNAGWAVSRADGTDGTYTMTAHIDASDYAITHTVDGFDLIHVTGMDQATGLEWPILPITALDLVLPISATVTTLALTPEQPVTLDNLEIPSYSHVSSPEAITATYTATLGGPYSEGATQSADPAGSYQMVRVQVLPAAYDAAADQATLYRSLDVVVTYDSDQRLALSFFEPDKVQYVPGEPVGAVARVINAGDALETAMATLVLQDLTGQVVGYQESDPIQVPAGGFHDIDIELTGPLDGDEYALRLLIWQDQQVVTGAGRRVVITAGELRDVVVPPQLKPGEEGAFTVTFDNLSASATVANVSLVVYDPYGVPAGWPEPQTVVVGGNGSATATFLWTPAQAGTYTVSAVALAGRQEYGPLVAPLAVVGEGLYLPLILRSY